MYIFNKANTPVRFLRSFFFLMALVCAAIYFFSITGYANEEGTDQVLSEETAGISETEEVQAESKIVFSKNIYHQHTGSSSGGGCYSVKKTDVETITEKCNGNMTYYSTYDSTQCDNCGAGYKGDQSGRKCWHETTTTKKYTYYDVGCNKSGSTCLGSVSVEKSTDEWVKNLTLTGFYEAKGMSVAAKPYIWNGGKATENNTYEVGKNGEYTLRLNADANANTESAVVKVNVKNVDITAPVVRAHEQTPLTDWTKEGVLFAATEVVDLQEDGSEGCGLHEMPYSYDGGVNWTAESSFLYTENGTHTVLLRDSLENTATYEIAFQNVDCTAPTIESVEYDRTKNIKDTVIMVNARDIQPDGSEGAGLHELPYSYDGGKTWTGENTFYVKRNATISIVVRDALDNRAYHKEVITNIDCMGPEISYKMEPSSWTNQDVEVKLYAKDLNEDGSEGVGLDSAWYSLDGGVTWLSKDRLEFDSNQTITIIARDKCDNRSSQEIKINQIDRDLPWVTLSMEQMGSGLDMQVKLIAQAGDEYSGLHESAYSWDKGVTYGTDNTLLITENGSYQITVRDKAGNWRYAVLEVDVFPIIEIPAIIKEVFTEPETKIEEELVEETEEIETHTYVVKQQERVEPPKPAVVQTVEEKWDWNEAVVIICLVLFCAGLLAFILLLLLRTIAIYVENDGGQMQYRGRLWMKEKDGRFEVDISLSLLEKCVTTHFLFRPTRLFLGVHKEANISFLFPEDICVNRQAEREIEISLL